jgi:hypothetical protein
MLVHHPGGNPGANLKSISHRYYLREVGFEGELTKEPSTCPWVASRVVFEKTHFDRQDPRSVLSYAVLLASSLPHNCLAELWSGSEVGSYFRLIDCCIAQL